MNKINTFTDLIAWQKGHKLVLEVYKSTEKWPKKEIYSLTSQIRRACVSVTSNIAEGFGRTSYREKRRFYLISRGSVNEAKNQLIIARDLGYIDNTEFDRLITTADNSAKLLSGLINKTRTYYS